MALTQQAFSRCIKGHRLLLCSTHINSVAQKRGLFYRKKKNIWTEKTPLWLFHDYKFTFQELQFYITKKQVEEIKEIQAYDDEKIAVMGNELAAAHIIVRLGGKVKFVGDDIWYQKLQTGITPIPHSYKKGYYVEAIDLSSVLLLYEALNYFYDLKHVKFISLSMSKNVDDWYIEKIIDTCPDIEALDISDCPNITDNGLEMLHRLKNLKVVNIKNCHNIRCSEAICAHLYNMLPDLTVMGLDSVPRVSGSDGLLEYEMKNSRYLVWGMIMNQRLDLNNEIDIDSFMESQMEKLGIKKEQKKNPAGLEDERKDVTETCNDDLELSDLNNVALDSTNS